MKWQFSASSVEQQLVASIQPFVHDSWRRPSVHNDPVFHRPAADVYLADDPSRPCPDEPMLAERSRCNILSACPRHSWYRNQRCIVQPANLADAPAWSQVTRRRGVLSRELFNSLHPISHAALKFKFCPLSVCECKRFSLKVEMAPITEYSESILVSLVMPFKA